MNWVVVVGVIIALMFLVAFTNWFYHIFAGINALIVEDLFVGYRIFGWGVGALLLMGGIFWINALIQECPTPEEDREGIFTLLDCRVYDWLLTTPAGNIINKPLPEEPAEPVKEEAPTYPG
jgi:hypothetical protein